MEDLELLNSLGVCGRCNAIVSITDYAHGDSMDAKWMCRCGAELTHTEFGYDKGERGAKKIKWVGPDGKWTDTEPEEDFKLGEVDVVIRMPSHVF